MKSKPCPFCGHSPQEAEKLLAITALSEPDRKQLVEAFECAVTGHPMEFKSKAAERVWKRYFMKSWGDT